MRRKEKIKLEEMEERIYLLQEEIQRLCIKVKDLEDKADGKKPELRRVSFDEDYDRLRKKYRPHMEIFMDGL